MTFNNKGNGPFRWQAPQFSLHDVVNAVVSATMQAAANRQMGAMAGLRLLNPKKKKKKRKRSPSPSSSSGGNEGAAASASIAREVGSASTARAVDMVDLTADDASVAVKVEEVEDEVVEQQPGSIVKSEKACGQIIA